MLAVHAVIYLHGRKIQDLTPNPPCYSEIALYKYIIRPEISFFR